MNIITVIWSMAASACLTLTAIHLSVWCNKRTSKTNLLFSLMAAATAALAFCELWMMRSETPGEFATALRWFDVPAWVIIVALVGFVLKRTAVDDLVPAIETVLRGEIYMSPSVVQTSEEINSIGKGARNRA